MSSARWRSTPPRWRPWASRTATITPERTDHPVSDLKGFGANGRVFFWLRQGVVQGQAVHVGFVADGTAAVDAAYGAAMAAGASDNGAPGARLHYDPRYYAANVFDPDGNSLEFVYKRWQHPQDLQHTQGPRP